MIEDSFWVGLGLIALAVGRNYYRKKTELTKAAIFLENAENFKETCGENWINAIDLYIYRGFYGDPPFSDFYKKTILKEQLKKHQSKNEILLNAEMLGYKTKHVSWLDL
ncbi:hypothetical protein [Desulfovibrio subterraneus]|uniref:Uncharacterized protein n=1 Tax=Desulfovibrio subterraneus TaxID=2718620 RepID=A0A7J0BHV9_9BACT|nr:hypothetical protein [Desulfovibrio subterraneus]GFM33267.1 hypothetical protein DSM101010T_16320 [Desulfovibrio subterraneus]